MPLALVWTICVNKPKSIGWGFGSLFFAAFPVAQAWVLAHEGTASDDGAVLCAALALSKKFITEIVEHILFVLGIHLGGLACGSDDRKRP